jgi:hypothetical protein
MAPSERGREEEYFARIEVEKKRQLAERQKQETEAREQQELKRLHWMKCPKCGMDLQPIHRGEVEIDTCFNCRGIWLDAGELEILLKGGSDEAGGLMRAVTGLFKGR